MVLFLHNLVLCLSHQVTKNRFDGDTGVVPLSFDRESLTLSGHFANKDAYSDNPVQKDLSEHLFEGLVQSACRKCVICTCMYTLFQWFTCCAIIPVHPYIHTCVTIVILAS